MLLIDSSFKDPGVSVADNYYDSAALFPLLKKTSDLNTHILGTYRISYIAEDPSHNLSKTIVRIVKVIRNDMPPGISLKGSLYITIPVNKLYKDPGVICQDDYSTVTVEKKGSFLTAFPDYIPTKTGSFYIEYRASDTLGNSATVIRQIKVVPQNEFNDNLSDIYLMGDSIISICRWSAYHDVGYVLTDSAAIKQVDTIGNFLQFGSSMPGLYFLGYKATDTLGNAVYSRLRFIIVLQTDNGRCKSDLIEGFLSGNQISVYPNPTLGLVAVTSHLPVNTDIAYDISDMFGKK